MSDKTNYDLVPVHIDTIMPGDTIFRDGHLKTVSMTNIGHDSLLGKCLFGDSYYGGHTPVLKVIFKRPKKLS